jgi:hypothetical protein
MLQRYHNVSFRPSVFTRLSRAVRTSFSFSISGLAYKYLSSRVVSSASDSLKPYPFEMD